MGADAPAYSPGLEGVIAGETSICLVDGEAGRLLYRGYPIGELVERGTYAQVAELLWTGDWPAEATLSNQPLPDAVLAALRALPASANPMDTLRTAVSAWGATERPGWPPTVEQARTLTTVAPSALAAFARLRDGKDPIDPDPSLGVPAGFLYQLTGRRPDPTAARALEAYFVVAAEHSFNASTFTARVIASTQSDMASAVCGAIGALKGPLHGGAPSEVVSQLHEIASIDRAEQWIDDTLDRGDRLMGFGHRVYRAYDPRAAALRHVAEGMAGTAEWLTPRRRGRGHRAAQARRAPPRPPAQDQCRVLHGRRHAGDRPAAGALSLDLRARAARRLDRACARTGRREPPHPPVGSLRRATGAQPAGRRIEACRSVRDEARSRVSARISGVIVAFNEEANIRWSVGSLVPWCDEVVVVDQESADRTAEIARELGARVVSHPNTPIVEESRAFSVEQATGDWIVLLDADEMIPATLARRLREIADGADAPDVVMIPRVNVVLGRWARVGAKNWPNRHPRFFRRGAVTLSGAIHRGIEVPELSLREKLPARNSAAIWHFSYESVADMMEKFDRYTSREARQSLDAGRPPATPRDLLVEPAAWLWSNYVRLQGYRDGVPGLIVAIARAYYSFMLAAKTWDLSRLDRRLADRDRMRARLLDGYPGVVAPFANAAASNVAPSNA